MHNSQDNSQHQYDEMPGFSLEGGVAGHSVPNQDTLLHLGQGVGHREQDCLPLCIDSNGPLQILAALEVKMEVLNMQVEDLLLHQLPSPAQPVFLSVLSHYIL